MTDKFRTSEGAFSNTDLDAIFEPIGPFSPVANVGYTEGIQGITDLSQLYAPLPEGGSAGPTSMLTSFNGNWSNQDLNTIFALLGSIPNDPVVWSGSPNINCYNNSPPSAPEVDSYFIQVDATFEVGGAPDFHGVWSFNSSEGDNDIPPNGGPYVFSITDYEASSDSGTWSMDSPDGADFEIRLASKSGPNFSVIPDSLTIGTWYSLIVPRTWSYATSSQLLGANENFLNFEMRYQAGPPFPVTFQALYGMEPGN